MIFICIAHASEIQLWYYSSITLLMSKDHFVNSQVCFRHWNSLTELITECQCYKTTKDIPCQCNLADDDKINLPIVVGLKPAWMHFAKYES